MPSGSSPTPPTTGARGDLAATSTARRESGEIGYWCGPWARRRGVMTAAVRLVRDWALRRARPRAPRDPRRRATTSPRSASPLAAGFRREGVMRGCLTVARASDATTCCYAHAARRPAARRRATRRAERPRLAAADGRPAGRPALRAGRCPGRPGGLRRPGRRPLDLRRCRRRTALADAECVHRRRAAPARCRRARPARRDRRGHRRAARQRQPRPLRRARRRPRSATGSSGRRAAGA